MEQVLQNMNKLNRSLEGIVAVSLSKLSMHGSRADLPVKVGGEFSSVEALWSRFETVMGKSPDSQEVQQDTGNAGTSPSVTRAERTT